jgi:hypothetical protein
MIGLVCGLLSNFCFAARNVITPSSPAAANDGDALFLAINIIATGMIAESRLFILLEFTPCAAALVSLWAALSRSFLPRAATPPLPPPSSLDSNNVGQAAFAAALRGIVLCGTSHFLYNYSSFAFLAATSPITHSIANCMRRVFVVAVSLLYFRNPVSSMAMCGTVIALAGVWLFTHVKNTSGSARPSLLPTAVEIKVI